MGGGVARTGVWAASPRGRSRLWLVGPQDLPAEYVPGAARRCLCCATTRAGNTARVNGAAGDVVPTLCASGSRPTRSYSAHRSSLVAAAQLNYSNFRCQLIASLQIECDEMQQQTAGIVDGRTLQRLHVARSHSGVQRLEQGCDSRLCPTHRRGARKQQQRGQHLGICGSASTFLASVRRRRQFAAGDGDDCTESDSKQFNCAAATAIIDHTFGVFAVQSYGLAPINHTLSYRRCSHGCGALGLGPAAAGCDTDAGRRAASRLVSRHRARAAALVLRRSSSIHH